MNVNVEAVLIVSGMIFVATMGGLGALWISARRIGREHLQAAERLRR